MIEGSNGSRFGQPRLGDDGNEPQRNVAQPSRRTAKLSSEGEGCQKTSKGHPLYGVDLKIADDLGNELPRDGKSAGRLDGARSLDHQRLLSRRKPLLHDGWFDSGDIAVLDDDNTVRLTDSRQGRHQAGGEWISSITWRTWRWDVPAWPKPRWSAFPIRSGKSGRCSWSCLWRVPAVTVQSIAAHLEARSPSGGCPTMSYSSDALSYGATGKIQKMELRRRFAGHYSTVARSTA